MADMHSPPRHLLHLTPLEHLCYYNLAGFSQIYRPAPCQRGEGQEEKGSVKVLPAIRYPGITEPIISGTLKKTKILRNQ